MGSIPEKLEANKESNNLMLVANLKMYNLISCLFTV